MGKFFLLNFLPLKLLDLIQLLLLLHQISISCNDRDYEHLSFFSFSFFFFFNLKPPLRGVRGAILSHF